MREMMPVSVVMAVFLVACAADAEQVARNDLMPRDAYARQLEGTAIIVDVRTPGEYESAHVDGAVNIPLDEVSSRFEELLRLAGDRDVVLYCRSGRRAAIAESLLRGLGVVNIYHLIGQLSGWADEGLPISQGG